MSSYILLNACNFPPEHIDQLCCVSDDGVYWYGPKVFKGPAVSCDGVGQFHARNIGEKTHYFWKYVRPVNMQAIYLDGVTGQVGCERIFAVNDDDSVILENDKCIKAGAWKFLTPDVFKEVMPNEDTSK